MFKSQKIRWKWLSTKNLVLVFLTIVLGFASVITLANIEITPTTNDTWQTISKTTITSAWSETEKVIELSSTGMYINNNILTEKTQFSWKVLGIDENGNIIYTYSDNFTGDNLWNHTATKNLKMWMHFISYSWGDNKWIGFDIDDNLHTAQKIKTQQTLQIAQDWETTCSTTNAGEVRFINECFQWCDGFSRNNIVGEWCNWIIPPQCAWTLPANTINTSLTNNWIWHFAINSWNCTYRCTNGYAATLTGLCINTPTTNPQMRLTDMDYWNGRIYFGGRFKDMFQITNHISAPILGFNIYVASVDTWGNNLQTSIIRLFTWNFAFLSQVLSDKVWNVYVEWFFVSWAIFDTITLTGQTNNALNRFIAKADSGWSRIWAKGITLNIWNTFFWSPLNKNYMTLDTEWNIYLIANFSPSPSFNGTANLMFWTMSTWLDFWSWDGSITAKISKTGNLLRFKKTNNLLDKISAIYNDWSNDIWVYHINNSTNNWVGKIDKTNGNIISTHNMPANALWVQSSLLSILDNWKMYYKNPYDNNIPYRYNGFNSTWEIPITAWWTNWYTTSDMSSDNNGYVHICWTFNAYIGIWWNPYLNSSGQNDVFSVDSNDLNYVGVRFWWQQTDTCAAITNDTFDNSYIGWSSYSTIPSEQFFLTWWFSPFFYIKKYPPIIQQ